MLSKISSNNLNTKQNKNLLAQNKNHTENDRARFKECYVNGIIPEYMEKSSKFDKLYDFIDIEDKKLISADGQNYIIAKEKPTHNNWPAFRIFSVNNKGEKNHIASILDYFGKGYTLYNKNGDVVCEKSYVREEPMFRVFDETLTGYAPNMNEIDRIKNYNEKNIGTVPNKKEIASIKSYDYMTEGVAISKLNTKNKLANWHVDFIDNFGKYLSEMTKYLYGKNQEKDVFLNADKYMNLEDVTQSAMKKSELLKNGKLSINNKNLLKIKTPFMEGAVPLFEKVLPSIKEGDSGLHIKFNVLRIGAFYGAQKMKLLGLKDVERFADIPFKEQETIFIKALSRYLTELNKKVPKQFDYIALMKCFMK